MSFKPIQDRMGKRKSRTIGEFRGSHYGLHKVKQPNPFAAVCDMIFCRKRGQLRPGMRKNQTTGYTATVTSLFQINIGDRSWLGSIQNGVLTAYDVEDVKEGIVQYYSWDAIKSAFTWSSLDNKTWNELFGSAQP